MTGKRALPDAKCPIRPGDACSLCQPGATGPQDCGLVYLVMTDPDLRDELNRVRREEREEARRKAEQPGAERPSVSTQTPDRPAARDPLAAPSRHPGTDRARPSALL